MTGKRIYQLLLSFLCILLAVLICSAAVRICRDGSRRKAEHPMEQVSGPIGIVQVVDQTPDRKKQVILRAVLLAAAALFIIAGICNGSMQDTFVKAANICTECIGLG